MHQIAGIRQRLILAYNPRTNGRAEVNVRMAKILIYKELQGFEANWDRFVPSAQLAMNLRIDAYSAFDLMFGRHPKGLENYDKTVESEQGG